MDDINDLLRQLERDDLLSGLPSDHRKRVFAKVQATANMLIEGSPRLVELRRQWESAPSGSPWQKALCDEINELQEHMTAVMKDTVGEMNAAKAAAAALKKK
ncbi:MAG TPA: hypothetical protein VKX17_09220 [Planctomycetota bacterium]|nr:hypothetical protein [Planctomycetota bacterium]